MSGDLSSPNAAAAPVLRPFTRLTPSRAASFPSPQHQPARSASDSTSSPSTVTSTSAPASAVISTQLAPSALLTLAIKANTSLISSSNTPTLDQNASTAKTLSSSSSPSSFPPQDAMNSSVLLQVAQPFRPVAPSKSAQSLSIPSQHLDRDGSPQQQQPPVGTPLLTAPPLKSSSSVIIRHLPLNTTEESVRLMTVFSKELADVQVLPAEQSKDPGFLSAILDFKSPAGAQEAKNMLDGKSNIANDAELIVDIVGDRTAGSSANASSLVSSSMPPQPRFSGFPTALDAVASTHISSSVYGSKDLANPENTAHYQSLFSPQSPIGNHMADRTRMWGKALIKNEGADDDDTRELLKESVAYAADTTAPLTRRATAPHIPTSRMAALSLNTTAPSGPPPLAPYGHPVLTTHPTHPGALSPPAMNAGGTPFNPHFRAGHNFPPVNPADQNPPCNTLYVGNLPIDTSEEELKALFSKQRGYKRLCFRTKQNGPMCFVEFEDVSFATKALHELYGQLLHNSVKGGIRLSFSKNPLGVRSGQALPGAGSVGSLPGMMGMLPASSFTTASGPPPGLSAPPGLGPARSSYSTAPSVLATAASLVGSGVGSIGPHSMGAMVGAPRNPGGGVYPDDETATRSVSIMSGTPTAFGPRMMGR